MDEQLNENMTEVNEFEEEFEQLLMGGEMDEEFEENLETKVVTVEVKDDKLENTNVLMDEKTKNLLYDCFNLPKDRMERNFGEWRLDVVHIRGVQEMSSEDVLSYFSEHDPSSIEWVNDLSCNVVFETEDMAAKAILDLSTAFVIKGENVSELDFPADIEVLDGDQFEVSIPPGRWRLGKKHEKAPALLLRFATFDDKKLKGSRKFSQYYFKYGYGQSANSDDDHVVKIVSQEDGVQKVDHDKDNNNDDDDDDDEDNEEQLNPSKRSDKFFRMRMRADDEENYIRSKTGKGLEIRLRDGRTSSRQVIDYGQNKTSIWDRLDTRMKNPKRGSVWDRLDKGDDLRMKLSQRRSRRKNPY